MSYDFPVDDKVMNTSCLRLWSCGVVDSQDIKVMGSGGSSQALHRSIFSMPQCLVSHLLHVVLAVACPVSAYLWCSCTGAVHKLDLHGEAAKRAVSANIAEVHGILWAGRVTGGICLFI